MAVGCQSTRHPSHQLVVPDGLVDALKQLRSSDQRRLWPAARGSAVAVFAGHGHLQTFGDSKSALDALVPMQLLVECTLDA
jgi:hypothetical protein